MDEGSTSMIGSPSEKYATVTDADLPEFMVRSANDIRETRGEQLREEVLHAPRECACVLTYPCGV